MVEPGCPLPARERWMRGLLVLIGVLTATPVLAVVTPVQLASYGITAPGPVELVLLQHRGVLQLLLGAALVGAALVPRARVAAVTTALCAKGAFLALVAVQPEAGPRISPVTLAFDGVSVVVLAVLLGAAAGRRSAAGAAS